MSDRARILIIDDEVAIGEILGQMLESEGFMVQRAATAGDGMEVARRFGPEVVVCDIRLPDGSGIEVLEKLRVELPSTIIIMITAYAAMEDAIGALKLGASDYLLKPILFEDLLHRIEHLLEHRRLEWETRFLRRALAENPHADSFVGHSAPMVATRDRMRKIAPTESTVLITGESGSGKDLIARCLHKGSQRNEGRLLVVNCSAIPETLLESELFGYRKGAFSGADADKEGLLSLASGGTLFLDEIGDLPLPLQPKLLRAMEAKEFIPLGATRPMQVDTRIMAATNRPLKEMVADGSFRQDLYYRLSLIELKAPSLRECVEDIPVLAEAIIDRLNHEVGRAVKGIEPAAMNALCAHDWPGNVRELENRIRRAMILGDADFLTCDDLFDEDDHPDVESEALRDAVRSFERRVIRAAIQRRAGDKRQAAEDLQISLASLYSKLRMPGEDAEPDCD